MILLGLRKVRVRDVETEFPLRKPLVAPVVVKTEVAGVNHGVRRGSLRQLVDDAESPVGVADQQESHASTPVRPGDPAGTARLERL